jgi:hypothetical protein
MREGRCVNFQDQKLICKDCGQEFIWSAGEQEFFAGKGLLNAPARCPSDRAARRARSAGDPDRRVGRNGHGGAGAGDRVEDRRNERPQ